jgi:hypothetical protein
MSENKFDEFFRKKLPGYSSPVPVDMWQRIQQKKDKDRKGFFFRWFLAGFALIFLIAGYFILHTNKNTVPKATTPASQQNIATQNNSNESGKDAGEKEPIKTDGDTTLSKENNKLSSNKHIGNNVKSTYSARHQHRRPVTSQNFSAKRTSPGMYILKQKKELAKHIRTSRSRKGSVDIHTSNASDSSIDNYRKDENIARQYADTAITNTQAIRTVSLPEDSLSKKAKTTSENKSEKSNELSSPKKRWFLEVYASPDIPFNEITSGNAATTDFIKKSFKTHLSYALGVGIGRAIDKHFSVKTGFQYSKISAKMVDSNGVGIANHYMSIDVPFLIGYEIKNIDFKSTINAGVIFNLYSWYKGNGIATYKNYTGISLYTGLNFAKQINNKIALFAEPYFRYRLSYITKPQAPFNQKIHVAGALFGIKYNF